MMQQKDQFYFKTPELTHRYELIQHLLEYSNHLVLVQGEKDSGKTSLFYQMKTPDESSLVMLKLSASAHTSKADILNAMVADMNATSDSFDPWGTSIEDFHTWLGRCNSKQQIPALLIDDVDLLDEELLAFIFNELCLPKEGIALHVCLFCEPSFLELARKQGLEENEAQSLHIIEMPYFNEKQTAQYLNHKYPDSESELSVFDEKTVKQIHRISHGMPGRINVLAEQYLNDPAKEMPLQKNKEIEQAVAKPANNYNWAIVVVVVLLVMLSTGMVYILNQTDVTGTGEYPVELPERGLAYQAAETQLETLSDPAREIAAVINEQQESLTDTLEQAGEQKVTSIEILEPPGQAPVLLELTEAAIVPDIPLQQEVVEDFDALQDIQIETGFKSTQLEPVTDAAETAKTGPDEGRQLDVDDVASVPVSTDLLITTVDPGTLQSTEPVLAPDIDESTAAPVQNEVEPRPDSTDEATPQVRDINWLLAQNKNSYVLQLIGANDKQTVDAYLKSIPQIAAETIRFTTTNNDRPWHVVVYGLFENRQQAVTALDTLPDVARATSPWPRPIKSILALSIQP